jgi:hypothetical protein
MEKLQGSGAGSAMDGGRREKRHVALVEREIQTSRLGIRRGEKCGRVGLGDTQVARVSPIIHSEAGNGSRRSS